jgi:CHAT domain-containing protein
MLAKILRREGREREARDVMEGLINEMFLLRQALPGVLGAWFWQTKDAIFEEYMAATLAQSGADSGKPVDGESALLALNHIRAIESFEQAPGDGADTRGDDAMRSLLARREAAAAAGTGEENLSAQVNQALKTIVGTTEPAISRLSSASLDKVLAGLSRDETLLTYYLGDSADYVIVGTRRTVSLLKLSGSSPVSVRLFDLRAQIQAGTAEDFWVLPELERIGRVLVGPVADALAQRIYLLPAGALNGFPFNALRLNGRFLAENHEVVNVDNLSASTAFHQLLQQDYPDRVFLAGNPQTSQELFSYDVQISPEISTLTDRFVGPGLQVVQGVALSTEEFRDARIVRAGLIHLAMPGSLDLGSPDRSRLLLSGTGTNAALEYLSPSDFHGLNFQAGLAVLSRSTVVGASPSGFDNRIGFVTDFLEAGVSNVLASLWVDMDSEPTGFVSEFYKHLETTRDAAEALSLTRMNYLKSQDDTNFRSWAGFQLFIR